MSKKIKYMGGIIYVDPSRISAIDCNGNQEGPFYSVCEAQEWIEEREEFMRQMSRQR